MMNSIIIEGYVKDTPIKASNIEYAENFIFTLQCNDIVRLNNKQKAKNNLRIKVILCNEIACKVLPFIIKGQKVRVIGEIFPEKKTRKLNVFALRIQQR